MTDHVRVAQQLPRLDPVLGAGEQLGHLVDGVDEHEAAGSSELGRERRHQGQREHREVGDRAADVAQHEQIGLVGARSVVQDVDRHAAAAERAAHRAAHVDAAESVLATPRQSRRQLAGDRPDRRPHLLELGTRRFEEVDVLQFGLDVGDAGEVELGADVGADQAFQFVDPGADQGRVEIGIGDADAAHQAGDVCGEEHTLDVVALGAERRPRGRRARRRGRRRWRRGRRLRRARRRGLPRPTRRRRRSSSPSVRTSRAGK